MILFNIVSQLTKHSQFRLSTTLFVRDFMMTAEQCAEMCKTLFEKSGTFRRVLYRHYNTIGTGPDADAVAKEAQIPYREIYEWIKSIKKI